MALWAWSLWIWLLGPWAIGLVPGFVASEVGQVASLTVRLQVLRPHRPPLMGELRG